MRRLSIDLTGLPPTPDEIRAFVSDTRADAYERVVDRLLASRAFGERWARHWLDLVGYADQLGLDNSVYAEHAWRYRDYVIGAFNEDKPYNRFVREQIAGDLLPYYSRYERRDNITATGFLVLGEIAIVDSDKERLRVDIIDQQIDKVGRAFLGMTLGCVRCHDHKFDPITQADYYGMAGMFWSSASFTRMGRGGWSIVCSTELPASPGDKTKVDEDAIAFRANLESMSARLEQLKKWKPDLVAIETSPALEDEDLRDSITRDRRAMNENMASLEKAIWHDQIFPPRIGRAFAVHDDKIEDMRITLRGNAHALGDRVPRGFIHAISPQGCPTIVSHESGRRQLADWIVDPANPLTARVAVNRIWQKLFGEGIVRSVDYFGRRGDQPSHPELLDYLASRFVSLGWSQKKLIRELVLSRTYRQSSASNATAAAIDPENRLLWRANRWRLDAEAIRDSMLLACGTLAPSQGGPAIPLEYVENVGNTNPKDVNPPGFRLSKYYPMQLWQRTIYLPVIRSGPQAGPAELRNVFDFTLPAICQGQRAATSVPTQSMFLMNSPMLNERSQELADRARKESSDARRRLDALWLEVFNRPITPAEATDCQQFMEDIRKGAKSSPAADADRLAWTELCHALLASNEFMMRL